MQSTYDVAIAGGGAAGHALAAMLAGRGLSLLHVHSGTPGDARPIALSWGSRQLLGGLGAWPQVAADASAIESVHVSHKGRFGRTLMCAADHGLPALGYVSTLDRIQASLRLQVATHGDRHAVEGRLQRWRGRPGDWQLELEDAGRPRTARSRLLVLADGGEHMDRLRTYGQTAIVGVVGSTGAVPGMAFERFTQEGPLALLPWGAQHALVWCVGDARARQLMDAGDERFLAQLGAAFGGRLGRLDAVSARAAHPLSLRWRSDVAEGGVIAIANAAQALHPVAGQGLNLGLRDCAMLARAVLDCAPQALGDGDFCARYRDSRTADRAWAMGGTDALVTLFGLSAPPAAVARGAALAALDMLAPARRSLARHMMLGTRAFP